MQADYTRYLAGCPRRSVWDVEATAGGRARIPPGAPYPPRPDLHPEDRLFPGEGARVLKVWQVVGVEAGRGWLETGRRRVTLGAGDVFLLFPGVAHRYAPEARTGWAESWVEFRGPLPERLRKAGLLRPDEVVKRASAAPAWLRACHERLRAGAAGDDARLSAALIQILAEWTIQENVAESRARGLVRDVERLLAEAPGVLPRPPELARKLGVSYAVLRRAFRAEAGLGLAEFRAELRHRRARVLLAETGLGLKEIAERLGYDSAYHLSADFKRHAGAAPSVWRGRLR